MKASELRALGPEELQKKLGDLKQELFNLRFQHGVNQLENPRKLWQTKKDIARIYTVMTQTGINQK